MSQKHSWEAIGKVINKSLIEKAASLHRKYTKAKAALNKVNRQVKEQGKVIRELKDELASKQTTIYCMKKEMEFLRKERFGPHANF